MISSKQSNTICAAILADRHAVVITWNPILTDVWGYTNEEIVGKSLYSLFIPEQKERIEKLLVDKIGVNSISLHKEIIAITKAGFVFNTILDFSPLYNSKNELNDFVVQITVDKSILSGKTNAELLVDKNGDINIVNNTPSGKKNIYSIWYWDLCANCITRGEGFQEMFGYDPANIPVDIREWEQLIHPNDKRRVINGLQTAIQGNENNWTEEYLFLKSDGTYTLVLDKGSIIRNEKGDAIQMIGAMHDLTKEKYEEEQLYLFQSIIESVNDCIIVTEAEPINGNSPKVLYVNKAFTRMTGYTKEETIGKTPRILQGPGTDRKELDRLRKSLENWESCEVEVLNYRKNGEPFWNNFIVTPLANAEGWYTHWISVQREVTNRKNAEEDLKQKNHELQELSAYLQTVREDERKYIAREMHEEMGQLVSALKIDVDWLQIKFAPEDEVTGQHFSHAIKTMDILINSIRKMAASLRPSILDDFGLNTALEWQCREAQKNYGIVCKFAADFDDSVLPVKTATELFRIGEEALKNTMLHSEAGFVSVTASAHENVLRLSVTDNGKGFDISKKRNSFGLMSLRERALSLNGELNIHSEPGNGTTIDVFIPLV